MYLIGILDDISWQISDGDRIGLIGANGTGKTTLLEIIAGVQRDYMGKVGKARWVRIGYLSQEPNLDENSNLRDEMLKIFKTYPNTPTNHVCNIEDNIFRRFGNGC